MGTGYGHVLPGLAFIGIGMWHLYNHIRLHCQHPRNYNPGCWFPAPRVRHLELYVIVFANLIYLFTELVVGPSSHHHPLDPADWSIPASHLHNFEHSFISVAFVIYGVFTLHLDNVRPRAGRTLEMLLGATVFVMEFLMFYLHSTDHSGVEGQYHWLLQTIIAVSLVTTLLGISHSTSFALGFTRSVSILFQGIWFTVIGTMVYTPKFLPKGCHLVSDDGFFKVPCDDAASLHRGKSLVNLQFASVFAAVVVFSVWFYLQLEKRYPEMSEYEFPEMEEGQEGKFLKPSNKKEQEKSVSLSHQVGK